MSTDQLIARADTLMAEVPPQIEHVDRALAALQRVLDRTPQDPFAVHWRLARGCFLMTEVLKNEAQRREYAVLGQKHAAQALALQPERVEPHYFLALNTAKIAEADRDLGLIEVMLKQAERAAAIDPAFDEAGPYRFMGKVYITAPSWPVSVGSAEKGVELLERAVKLAPVPLNRVFLGEAYYKDDEYKLAHEQLTLALQQVQTDGVLLDPRWRAEAEATLVRLKGKDLSDE
jgi:tetratricopeptide (TPR) repeat protein